METFIKAIYPKKIIFHSQPNTFESRQFRSYLQKKYSRKGEKPQFVRKSINTGDLQKRIIDKKIEKSERKRVNIKTHWIDPNWIRSKKPSGAKLIHSKPILQLEGEPPIEEDEDTIEINLDEEDLNKDEIKSPNQTELEEDKWENTGSNVSHETDRDGNCTSEEESISSHKEENHSSQTLELILSDSENKNSEKEDEEDKLDIPVEILPSQKRRENKLKQKIHELFDNDNIEEPHTPIANTQDFMNSLEKSDSEFENEKLDNSDLIKMMEDQKINYDNYDLLLNQ